MIIMRQRVLVKLKEKDNKGIIMVSENDKTEDNRGIVVEVGQGIPLSDGSFLPLTVRKGDEVVFGKYDGKEIEINGEKLLILLEDNIMAITNRS